MNASEEPIEHIRHSLAHLLAAAVIELYPHARPALGPATSTGFYYDFDFSEGEGPTDNDLKKIEEHMRTILSDWGTFTKTDVTVQDAYDRFKDNPYKQELIKEYETRGEPITLYTSGEFTDLCKGGHVENAQHIHPEAFTLSSLAGAYWRGDEHNKMLTRIYGIAFHTPKELDEFVAQKEEALQRDHRKLGKELNLFTFSDLVGSGLPLWTPRGTMLRTQLQQKLTDISYKYGMQPVTIPHLAKRKLYETSGHAEKFSDELLIVQSHYDEFVLKPVNCPHHTQIYASVPRSYRDLPVRFMESTMQYRDEKPGEIGGLTRVRAITCDDGHIFCTPDQIEQEVKNLVEIIREFYTHLGMYGNHWVSLSVRDPHTPEAYIGTEEGWNKAETMLHNTSDDLNLDATRVEGEAALYGPKLDFMFKDSLGREWQLATIQIDFAMPERFELAYTDKDGSKKTPVMIHRAILGSYERFLAILIEHFAGAFPFWLAPTQVVVLPIGDAHGSYARDITDKLCSEGFRAVCDDSDESLGKRIHKVQKEKTPYHIVVGDNEKEHETVTLESRDNGTEGEKNLTDVISLFSSLL